MEYTMTLSDVYAGEFVYSNTTSSITEIFYTIIN
jgi:hypothetical protein